MLHARILRPPAHKATLDNVDTSAAEKIEGVRVVRDGTLIAVLHERRDVADKALQVVKATVNRPAPPLTTRPFDHSRWRRSRASGERQPQAGEQQARHRAHASSGHVSRLIETHRDARSRTARPRCGSGRKRRSQSSPPSRRR
jgi:hypothetical protein